jgi:hypothetical protein
MMMVCWVMSGNVRTYDFTVVLESMIVQYLAPDVRQTRVPHLMLGVIIASK